MAIRLESILSRWTAPGVGALVVQFLRFGTVGVFGFVVDTAIVYGLRGPIGLYAAAMVSYLVVASLNWALHRAWTFRGQGSGPAHRQWTMFLTTNLGGLVLNRGTFYLLVVLIPVCAVHPVIAVAAGAVAGMFVNFHLSRTVAFR